MAKLQNSGDLRRIWLWVKRVKRVKGVKKPAARRGHEEPADGIGGNGGFSLVEGAKGQRVGGRFAPVKETKRQRVGAEFVSFARLV